MINEKLKALFDLDVEIQIVEYKQSIEEEEQSEEGEKKYKIRTKKNYPKLSEAKFFEKVKTGLKYTHTVKNKKTKSFQKREGKFPKLILSSEKKQNQFIVRIFNLHCFEIEHEPVLEMLKKECRTGGSVQEIVVEKKPQRVVVVRGPYIDTVKDLLEQRGGVQAEFIEIRDKLKKKKKQNFQI